MSESRTFSAVFLHICHSYYQHKYEYDQMGGLDAEVESR